MAVGWQPANGMYHKGTGIKICAPIWFGLSVQGVRGALKPVWEFYFEFLSRFKLFIIIICSVSDPDPDPDPYGSVSFGRIRIRIRIRKPLIWIRVAPKINQNHGINKSEWFVNVLFTWRKFFKIIFNNLIFTFI